MVETSHLLVVVTPKGVNKERIYTEEIEIYGTQVAPKPSTRVQAAGRTTDAFR